ncbi:MAG TPA: flagellar hook-associated protein FlgK [Steroidobacteraceae bacterium]|nr:flagellar hook-associated protein FlgK [Steroidobacteraceae bacterium]
MADLLSNGISGLEAFQRALTTTSHNIANVSTAGYSRQSVLLTARAASLQGNSWIGNGVDSDVVSRAYSAVLTNQFQAATSTFQQLDTYSTLASNLTNLFGDSTTGLSATLQKFSDSIQTLVSNPSDTATRQTVLSQAQNLVTQLKSYQQTLDQTSSQVESSLTDEASTVTSLASSVASLNAQIVAAKSQSNQQPNDLLDQRDQLIAELSSHLNVSTVVEGNGAMDVYVGNGQALVIGTSASTVKTTPGEYDQSQSGLGLYNGVYTTDITSSVSGGTIGGLLQFRSDMLNPAYQALGQLTTGLATQFNTQQSQGLDATGQLGAALFNIGAVGVKGSLNNGGAADITATRSDIPAIGSGNYLLAYDGTNWNMTDQSTGASIAMTGSGTSADPFVGGGLSLVVGGTAQAGDRYEIDPWTSAVSGTSVAITNPAGIATAAPVLASATASNTGTGAIVQSSVPDTSTWVRGNYTLSFTDPSTWQVTDSSGNTVATGAYTAGTPISFNGVQVTLSGAPATGDTFSIKDNINGTGDNNNAQAMADLFDAKYFNGGTNSLNDFVDSFTTSIATTTNQVQTAASAQQTVLTDATSALQSESGVNLDEEAAKLIQYQQAYQAAAKVIQVSNTLFDSLLTAVQSG